MKPSRRIRALAGKLLPSSFRQYLTRHKRLRFTGPHDDWNAARAASQGYDCDLILERSVAAARNVVAGAAAYERDSVLFREPNAEPLLLNLLEVGNKGLTVLDFGGGMGSTYFQMRPHLRATSVSWQVVEQPAFARAGREGFQTSELLFFDDLSTSRLKASDVILASSVLQYLPDPWSVLHRFAELPGRHLAVLRTPFSNSESDFVGVQHVPAEIYPVSYPCWVFSKSRFSEFWSTRAVSLTWHSSPEGNALMGYNQFKFESVIIER